MLLKEMSASLKKGQANKVVECVENALKEEMDVKQILNEGLLKAMGEIGERFKNNEVFVPEVLIAARAMNAGLAVLEPHLVDSNVEPTGKVVIGTVKGDLHDIGKNLVAMMMKGAGFDVHDVGVDVAPEKFIDTAEEVGADIICMSALLTTTMTNMELVINELNERKLRDKYIVMVGGAPITTQFAEKIGANVYTKDAATAAQTAKKLVIN